MALCVAACDPALVSPTAPPPGAVAWGPFDDTGAWIDAAHRVVSRDALRGEGFIVAPFVASCTTRCPRTLDKLRGLEVALERRHSQARVVLFTLDPESDDAGRLSRFRAERRLPASWWVLRGPRDATRRLARRLGIHAAYDDQHVDHDVRITVFDSQGRALRTYDDWDFDEGAAAALADGAVDP